MSGAPQIRGWCPGAYRPMASGDGLVVRVRPWSGRLTAVQVAGLCAAACAFGTGTLDLTSRANLQIRGVAEPDHPALIERLAELGLLDQNAAMERRRNLIVAPFRDAGGRTERLCAAIHASLGALPDLPPKMGIAVDIGPLPCLADVSADFRFEIGEGGGLILRADGARCGRPVDEASAIPALVDMAVWFVSTGGPEAGRMARHLRRVGLPQGWCTVPPVHGAGVPQPGPALGARIYGAPFGRIEAGALADLVTRSGATAMTVAPWRLFLLDAATEVPAPGFVTRPGDPLLAADACSGAPFCPQAAVETRALAERLVQGGARGLHVSGCAKGCARPRAAPLTLVGRSDGLFDLVRDGAPWDEPTRRGLAPTEIPGLF